jgi:hypothetical protein
VALNQHRRLDVEPDIIDPATGKLTAFTGTVKHSRSWVSVLTVQELEEMIAEKQTPPVQPARAPVAHWPLEPRA